jgi:UDPglucose 6-dehydrogenase
MRESSSSVILKELMDACATVKAFDPVAMDQARKEFPDEWLAGDRFKLDPNQYQAIENTDALILVTEWKTFRQPDFKLMAGAMRQQIIFDGRNQYDPNEVKEAGFEYHGIGRENI